MPKISEDFQIDLPRSILDQMGLKPSDELLIEYDESKKVISLRKPSFDLEKAREVIRKASLD